MLSVVACECKCYVHAACRPRRRMTMRWRSRLLDVVCHRLSAQTDLSHQPWPGRDHSQVDSSLLLPNFYLWYINCVPNYTLKLTRMFLFFTIFFSKEYGSPGVLVVMEFWKVIEALLKNNTHTVLHKIKEDFFMDIITETHTNINVKLYVIVK